jgi:hypothetical protein
MKEDLEKVKEIHEDDELNQLIDTYYQLDFEDIIAGGIKTRFKVVTDSRNNP